MVSDQGCLHVCVWGCAHVCTGVHVFQSIVWRKPRKCRYLERVCEGSCDVKKVGSPCLNQNNSLILYVLHTGLSK